MSKLARSIAILLVFAIAAAAQSPGQDWSSVKALAPGTDVRVTAARTVRGTLQSVTDDSLIVNSGKGLETLARQEIARVSVKERGGHRGRNTLIGAAVGAGIGVGIGAAIGRCKGFCVVSQGDIIGVTAGALAAVGAIIGVIIPTGGWRDVYRK